MESLQLSNRRINFLKYPIDNLTFAEVLKVIDLFVKAQVPQQVSVMNANKMYLMDKKPELKKAIINSGLILGENAIYFGSKWINKPLKEKNIGGIRLIQTLLEQSTINRYRYYFLGSTDKIIGKMKERCAQLYPDLGTVGWHHGYFSEEESDNIVTKIRQTKPDILFVALGSPKQELWIYNNLENLEVPVCIGVGGSFEVISEVKKDVPQWAKNGFEWFLRSLQDPKKFKRYLVINTFFMIQISKYFLGLFEE